MRILMCRRHHRLPAGLPAPLLFCALYAYPAGATTLVVPDQVATIGAAIGMAVSGDTVLVRPGTHTESLVLAGEEVVLISAGDRRSRRSTPLLLLPPS